MLVSSVYQPVLLCRYSALIMNVHFDRQGRILFCNEFQQIGNQMHCFVAALVELYSDSHDNKEIIDSFLDLKEIYAPYSRNT